jgi:hypothetical protein
LRYFCSAQYIDTLMFKADTAYQPLSSPLDLVVVGE